MHYRIKKFCLYILYLWFTVAVVYNFISQKLQFIWLVDLNYFEDLFLFVAFWYNLHKTHEFWSSARYGIQVKHYP